MAGDINLRCRKIVQGTEGARATIDGVWIPRVQVIAPSMDAGDGIVQMDARTGVP